MKDKCGAAVLLVIILVTALAMIVITEREINKEPTQFSRVKTKEK